MMWICPKCGKDNLQEPCNSRHHIKCLRCNADRMTPEEYKKKLDEAGETLEARIEILKDKIRDMEWDRMKVSNTPIFTRATNTKCVAAANPEQQKLIEIMEG